jgi:acetolactate synthase I/II/III large subunit
VNVADVLVDELVRAGATRLYGVPGGGSSLDLLEAARRRGLPFVLTHGETAACIMAAVTADLTGAPGAALTALGPGVTSAVNGCAHALLDRSPMVILSDRHPDGVLGFTTHQRLDHAAVLAAATKASLTVDAASAARRVAEAVRLAMAEPRGPVHLDVAADVAAQAASPAGALPSAPRPLPDARALDEAARLIAGAARPLLLLGLGARSAALAPWLRALAEALPAPALATYKAKGVLPDPHPLVLGIFTGGAAEEPLVRRADLIVAVGLDPVELIPRPWAYDAPVLHLGSVAASGDHVRPAHEVVGDLPLVIEELAPRLKGRALANWDVAELDRLKREGRRRLALPVAGLAPHRVVEIARQATPAGTIATVDAGAHMFPVTAFWDAVAPDELLISNGLATMGFALPAAIAARLARPARPVVCFTGDGGLLMALAELETAARLGLPLVVVAFNDASLSLIRIKQEQRGLADTPLDHAGPDFTAVARGFGIAGFPAETEGEFARALEAALAAGRPALVDARVDAGGYREMLEVLRGAPAGGTRV